MKQCAVYPTRQTACPPRLVSGPYTSSSPPVQELVPDAVLVGDTAAAHHAGHRVSLDDDHVVTDLRVRFDEILADLEATQGSITARVQRPLLILGRLDGVETGVRNLIRRQPLEVERVRIGRRALRVPTLPEILRVKAWLAVENEAPRAGSTRCHGGA